jgi:hypothetical protein
MRISRLILSGAAIGTIIGTGRADLNATHVFNPAWPPHARFHNATGWGTVTGSQLLALWLLWRPGQQAGDRDTAVTTADLDAWQVGAMPLTTFCTQEFWRHTRPAPQIRREVAASWWEEPGQGGVGCGL